MNLHIGTTADGKPFTLPADLTDKKIAMLAQSNMGKTYGLGVILEELCKAQRPFIATDPANNLWGLRVLPDGTPSGLPVIVIGGDHGDIPLEKHAGERLAEALISEPVCAVIDTAFETMGTVRHFMTDFAGRLMRTKPEGGRVIVLEECPVLIPQKAHAPQMEICKAAVLKLLTIGGNFGYGVIPASQRPATIDKDALSQCEALIVMGISHKADRNAIKDWMDAKDIGERAAACFSELGSLTRGQAWFWWPSERRFEKFTFRKRETLHPREMRKLNLKASDVRLGDSARFVERVKRELSKTVVTASEVPKNSKTRQAILKVAEVAAKSPTFHEAEKLRIEKDAMEGNYRNQVDVLKTDLAKERGIRARTEERLQIVRDLMKPQYDTLKRLFEEIGETSQASGGEITAVWEPWLAKAAKGGCRRVLEILIKKGRLTQTQLATLSGVPVTGRSWRDYRSWLTRNALATLQDGDYIEIVKL